MPTHVALLRGINVGGGGKVPMSELRQVVAGLGHRDVATYIQTGNIIFTPSHDDSAALAAELEAAVAESFGVRSSVVVLSRSVHGVFLLSDPDEAAHQRLADALKAATQKGSRDEATIIGRTLYLHTPDGFGTSELA